MGGCCCCSSRRAETDRAPVYFYCPRNVEEREQLTSNSHGTSSTGPAGLYVDTNLDTATPDTFRAPPAPLPYDADLARSQISPGDVTSRETKIGQLPSADSQPMAGTVGHFENELSGVLEQSGSKDKTNDSVKLEEDAVKKALTSTTDDEDVCPTCLEEYDLENPRIMTKCEHHFHLSCILEWRERSDTCPVCDQIMMIDETYHE